VTKAAGLLNEQPRWGAGCSFLDYNRDGNLDLFVSNYVRFSFEHAPVPGKHQLQLERHSRGMWTARTANRKHSLYRNNGDGRFTDVSRPAGIAQATQSYGMTVVVADLDEDGWPDIYVACDSTPSLLFMNNRDGTFREEGVLRGVASATMARSRQEWAWESAIMTSTDILISSRRISPTMPTFFIAMTVRGISTM